MTITTATSVLTKSSPTPKYKTKRRSNPRLYQYSSVGITELGQIFRLARESAIDESGKPLSLEDVSTMTGFPRSNINAFECGARESVSIDLFSALFDLFQPRRPDGVPFEYRELLEIALEKNVFLEPLQEMRESEEAELSRYQNRLQQLLSFYIQKGRLSVKEIAQYTKIPASRIQQMVDGIAPTTITAFEAAQLSTIIPCHFRLDRKWEFVEDFIEFICEGKLVSDEFDATNQELQLWKLFPHSN